MNQRPARKTQFKPNRRRRLFKWLTIILIFVALGCTAGLLIPGLNSSRNASVKLSSPLKIVQKVVSNSSSSTADSTNTQLQDAWKSTLQQADGHVTIAVYSNQTKKTYTASNATNHSYRMASTVKVSILVGLLMKQGTLNSSEQANAQAMIENSSNTAASALFVELGEKSGLQETFDKLGMTDSKAHEEWGLSTTTPSDQLKLLNAIFYSSNLLSTSQQSYVRNLMQNVESDQQWGISAGSTNFYLKNGWLDEDDGWIINSIGYIPGNNGASDSYTIAVYTDDNSSMQNGENTIEKLAKSTSKILNK